MRSAYAIERQDSALTAASKIIRIHLDSIEQCAQDVVDREDTDPLHDFRIGVRKLRSALKLFARQLESTSAREIDRQLAEINRTLGPARDFDAWLEYLQSGKIKAALQDSDAYAIYVATLEKERLERLPELCFLLSANYNQEFKAKLHSFVAQELAGALANDNSEFFYRFSAKRLRKEAGKVCTYPTLDPSSNEALLHEVRKKCRRLRFWAEFSFGEDRPIVDQLAKAAKAVSTSLGTTRDMQLHVSEFESRSLALPKELLEWHRLMEQRAWRKYRKHWKKLTSREFQREVSKELKNGG